VASWAPIHMVGQAEPGLVDLEPRVRTLFAITVKAFCVESTSITVGMDGVAYIVFWHYYSSSYFNTLSARMVQVKMMQQSTNPAAQ